MELKDLPIELTEQLIPKDQTILKLPTEQCIHWLNLFHPRETLMILEAGFKSTEKENYLNKFRYKIYFDFGEEPVKKKGAKGIILEYKLVTGVIARYASLFRHFQIWTGNPEWHSFVWLSKVSLKHLNRQNLTSICLGNTDSEYLSGSFQIFMKFYQDIFTRIVSETETSLANKTNTVTQTNYSGGFFNCLDDVAIQLNYDQYQVLATSIAEYKTVTSITLRKASIFIEPTKNSPVYFPVKIVTNLFKPTTVFTLHYFGPNTSVEFVDDLTVAVPKVKYRIWKIGL
ncbi:hypothetical protein KGF54_005619 [Candida jiufengensis]|uniref:uncharacterized protein n=1 Tax=Candida jiufengensis TaxID=497108 RepID=UPI00222428A2|nr:uncharacterized protein KGF54_005619 [Candida jiufengensis]KAI5949384.1 hypothetical protein KGF54_005619 [Candida jiufengensis]